MQHQCSLQHSEKANHLSLSSATLILSIAFQLTTLRSILTLFLHLHIGFLSGHSPSGFPTKTLLVYLSSPLHATCPTHLIFLDLVILLKSDKNLKSRSSTLRNFLNFPTTFSSLGPHIFFSKLFFKTFS